MEWQPILEEVIKILLTAVVAVLSAVVPFAVRYSIEWIRVRLAEAKEELKSFNPHIYDIVSFLSQEAVVYAEQKGIEASGKEKMEMATKYLERELSARGYDSVDVEVMMDKIEVALFEQFNLFKDEFIVEEVVG